MKKRKSKATTRCNTKQKEPVELSARMCANCTDFLPVNLGLKKKYCPACQKIKYEERNLPKQTAEGFPIWR